MGYFLANSFGTIIREFDHWIAFTLLLFIGIKMIWEGTHPDKESDGCNALSFKEMIVLAIATSIDAMAVGIVFSCDSMPLKSENLALGIFASCFLIAVITFVLSTFGVKVGKILENKLNNRAEIAGGIVLILLGAKILFEHLTNISLFGI